MAPSYTLLLCLPRRIRSLRSLPLVWALSVSSVNGNSQTTRGLSARSTCRVQTPACLPPKQLRQTYMTLWPVGHLHAVRQWAIHAAPAFSFASGSRLHITPRAVTLLRLRLRLRMFSMKSYCIEARRHIWLISRFRYPRGTSRTPLPTG